MRKISLRRASLVYWGVGFAAYMVFYLVYGDCGVDRTDPQACTRESVILRYGLLFAVLGYAAMIGLLLLFRKNKP